jgi:hypothetical protein
MIPAETIVHLGLDRGEHGKFNFEDTERKIREEIERLPQEQRSELNRDIDDVKILFSQLNSNVVTPQARALRILMGKKRLENLLNKIKATFEKINEESPKEIQTLAHEVRESLDRDRDKENITNRGEEASKDRGETKSQDTPPAEENEKDWSQEYWKEKVLDSQAKRAKAEEEAKTAKSGVGKTLSQILGATLVGGGAIANFIGQQNSIKAQKEMYEDMKRHAEKAKQEAEADPNNSKKQAEANAALKALEMEGRKSLMEEASKLTREYLNQRQKAATDIGLNLGNFAKIFGSNKNRDSLQDIRDVDRLMNIQTKKLNSYL